MGNGNTITINGIVQTIIKEAGEFYLSMPNATSLLRVKAEEGLIDTVRLHIGKRISVTGKLCSEDVLLINPCKCNTVSRGIESYITADSISDGNFINRVTISGAITEKPKFIHTKSKDFYTCRIHLNDDRGYVSISTMDYPGDVGMSINVNGKLRWKDYNRKVECKRCKKVTIKPTLTLLVIENE